jgi:AcrR family transcriptional regulator
MRSGDEDVSRGTGRREANKQATRAALRRAAERLFAEHGFQATTVAQIADAAGVAERTFYRYFDTKEDLLAERAISWVDLLAEAIRARPAAETPYQAVAGAMSTTVRELTQGQPEDQAWLLGTTRPLDAVRRVEPRPLRRLEQAIAGAVLARQDATARPRAPEAEFEALLLAAVAVATLRTVITSQRSRSRGRANLDTMLAEAFSSLSQLASSGPS